ncbi:MAG: hypothetical protein LBH03_04755, partial [Holophagales bacterium]|nr:hypothetical protein [Holophagales bacterium]
GNAVTVYETAITSISRASENITTIKERPLLLTAVAVFVLVTASAGIFYYKNFKVLEQTKPPIVKSHDTDSFANDPDLPQQTDVEPKTGTSLVNQSQSVDPKAVPTTTVIPPRMFKQAFFTGKFSEDVAIPLEFVGRLYRAKVKIGVDGKVLECSILDKNVNPDEEKIAIACGMKMIFSPALTADGEPVVSETAVAIQLGKRNT